MRSIHWFYLFFFLTAGTAQASKMPLLAEGTVTTTAEVLNRIQIDSMALIKAKYSDLQQNFTPHFLTTGLDLDCRSGTTTPAPDAQFAGLRMNTEAKTLESGEIQTFTSLSHYDCQGQLIFTERVRAIGPAPALITVEDAVKFVRSFEVQANERARHYQIEDRQSTILFSVSSQRLVAGQGERIYSVMEIAGIKWLEFDQFDPSINERRLYIQLHSGVFQIGDSKFRMNFGSGAPVVLQTVWTDRKIEHYVDGALTNQVGFDSFLSANVSGLTQQMLNSIFSIFIARLPETKKVQVGVSDSPFLRELQLNYNRLLTNSETGQVKIFFQKTIEDIKSGKIKVE